MNKLKYIIFLTLIWLFPSAVYGTSNYAGDFLLLGSGARALGMGGSFVAVKGGSSSIQYNPSGLVGVETPELELMHSEQFGGLENFNAASIAHPLGNELYGGISLLHVGVGNIKYTRLLDPSSDLSDSNRAEIASREDAANYALFFSAAKNLGNGISVGGSVKLIRMSVGPSGAFGYGLDIGGIYEISRHFTIAAAAKDITGTTIAWDGASNDRIAPTLDLGIAYRDELPYFTGQYILAGSMSFFGDSPEVKGIRTMNIGFEYVPYDFLVLRAGSHLGNAVFGFGLRNLPLLFSTSLDYAFLSHGYLDDTHRISMRIVF